MYHDEPNQEGYLILSGEAIVIVEGEERRVRAWDYVHLPPWTDHVLVGAGERPCVFVAVGARSDDGGAYRANPVAQKYGAAVDEDTPDPAEAYARFSPIGPRRPPKGVLQDW
jgi:oxalate decarboxylase/phosphoglucose isomerase-like protein (cupin superfamily)